MLDVSDADDDDADSDFDAGLPEDEVAAARAVDPLPAGDAVEDDEEEEVVLDLHVGSSPSLCMIIP